MKVRATLTLRNEAAIAAREKLGMTQIELGDACGVSQSHVSAVECLRFCDVSEASIEKLAAFLCVDAEELVPPELRKQALPNRHTLVRDMAPTALLGLSATHVLENKDAPMEALEMQAAIRGALDVLTFREREIIKLRYGLRDGCEYTVGEVGRIFGMTHKRVRQAERRALYKLMAPANAAPLRSAVFGADGDGRPQRRQRPAHGVIVEPEGDL